jgi:hypothetical protein
MISETNYRHRAVEVGAAAIHAQSAIPASPLANPTSTPSNSNRILKYLRLFDAPDQAVQLIETTFMPPLITQKVGGSGNRILVCNWPITEQAFRGVPCVLTLRWLQTVRERQT